MANLDIPNRSHKVFPLSIKVKILDKKAKKKSMMKLLRSMVGTNVLSMKV